MLLHNVLRFWLSFIDIFVVEKKKYILMFSIWMRSRFVIKVTPRATHTLHNRDQSGRARRDKMEQDKVL